MEHPSFSPDLDPNDFRLFPKIKSDLKGRRFEDIKDIQIYVTMALKFQNISYSGSIVGLNT
jgi:hypothetical protein